MLNRIVGFITILMCSIAWGQTPSTPSSSAQSAGQQSMPGMSGHDMSTMQMKDMPTGGDKDAESDASAHVMKSMEGHMDMGPHMKMTALRQPKPGDAARAQQVAEEARKASEKYTDYHAALADGYKIFHPEVPQKMYHFTNYGYALEARFRFNPEHPDFAAVRKAWRRLQADRRDVHRAQALHGRSTRRARSTERSAMARARELLRPSG